MKLKGWMAGVTLSFLCLSSGLYAERVEIPEGRAVQVRLRADLLSTQVQQGDAVYFEVARPVIVRGMVAIPAGALVWGAVQSVKEDKVIRFDIERLRLPDLTVIKLRCVREKPKKASRDEIKVESELGDTVGAAKGTIFTAYVDEAIPVEAAAAPSPAPGVRRSAPSPAPAVIAPPAVPAPQPAVPAPQATAPASAVPAEPVTLECFSEPTAADIVLDGDFRGTTPSILKIPPGKHHLEYQLPGYNLYSRDLDLSSGMGVQTIRASLQKKE